MWSSNNFKSTVSPHELVQALSVESQRRFGPGQRAECLDLLVWLLGSLQRGLGKAAWAHSTAATSMRVGSATKARSAAPAQSSSVLYEPFQVMMPRLPAFTLFAIDCNCILLMINCRE